MVFTVSEFILWVFYPAVCFGLRNLPIKHRLFSNQNKLRLCLIQSDASSLACELEISPKNLYILIRYARHFSRKLFSPQLNINIRNNKVTMDLLIAGQRIIIKLNTWRINWAILSLLFYNKSIIKTHKRCRKLWNLRQIKKHPIKLS